MCKNSKRIGLIFLTVGALVAVFIILMAHKSYIINSTSLDYTGDWISFFGDIIGAVMSGTITFVALYCTIRHEENLRQESLRDSIYPLLSYKAVIKEDNKNLEGKKTIPTATWFAYKGYKPGTSLKNNLFFDLTVENVGLGVVINPRVLQLMYDGETHTLSGTTFFPLLVGENAIIPLHLLVPTSEFFSIPMSLKIGYYNLLRDYYVQEIGLKLIITPVVGSSPTRYIYSGIEVSSQSKPTISSTGEPGILNAEIVHNS